ncbi:nucleolar pre-ribosomal-associated protein 2 [Paramyrothecium foliicola]|nr:nucleolar pre-ribosomal-associated protein 2 [Paramyrothecium foliicola]
MMDLIKIVRSLDQKGPGAQGENLHLVWKSLATSTETSFHAVEESCLRWLLKSMNGSSEGAELLRRYPLTWAILGCVFRRIPLFSLAKSLADRRFTVILQQTLKEVSKPSDGSASSASTKRKRSDSQAYDLASLQTRDGCIASGQAIFTSLKYLLQRLDTTVSNSSSDKIGFEHIKSLFCTSASEAVALARPFLLLCNELLLCDGIEAIEGRGDWIETLSTVWDFHLQATDDASVVATHLFAPSATILARLEKFSPHHVDSSEEDLRRRWSHGIRQFMCKNLISPARSAFVNHQDDSTLITALEVAKGQADYSAPSMYVLAIEEFKVASRQGLRKNNVDWMKRVFKAIENVLRQRSDRNQLARVILEQAVQQSITVGIDDLRRVARDYALPSNSTDWPLLASLSKCDPDIFHTSDESGDLLDDVCRRSVDGSISEVDAKSISQVIGAIMHGHRMGRDFSGFLKLWLKQMCRVNEQVADDSNPWLAVAQMESQDGAIENLIEKELLPKQLVEVVQWAAQQDADAASICVFSDAVARGIQSEPFVDAIGRTLFDLVWQANKSDSQLTALKWRVVSRSMAWAGAQERSLIWQSTNGQLSAALEKAPLDSTDCFEAFKCCCQAWVSVIPDGDEQKSIAAIATAFIIRLTKKLGSSNVLKKHKAISLAEGHYNERTPFNQQTALEHYLEYYLWGCSRLTRMINQQNEGTLPQPLDQILSTKETDSPVLRERWDAIFSNEISLNTVNFIQKALAFLVSSFEATATEKHWPNAQALMCMQSLNAIPLDTFDREDRERAMKILNRGCTAMLKSVKKSQLTSWKLLFSLATKLMSRATFYEDMSFADLLRVADGMSELSFDAEAHTGVALEIVERFSSVARAYLRQMAEHVDERSIRYFTESATFVSDCQSQAAAGDECGLSPVRITLLKAIVVEMRQFPGCRTHEKLGEILERAQEALSDCIVCTFGKILSEKKIFKSQNTTLDLAVFAIVDASSTPESLAGLSKFKQSTIRKLDKRSKEAMQVGDARGWAVQTFLRTHLAPELEVSQPTSIDSLLNLPAELRLRLLGDYVDSVVRGVSYNDRFLYLKKLIDEVNQGRDTDGQMLAIQHVTNQLLEPSEPPTDPNGYDLAKAHADLVSGLSLTQDHLVFIRRCRILQVILEKRPQSMSQWNIELTLSTTSLLMASNTSDMPPACFISLCKLVETIIKKHRLRLEGHFHLLLNTLQALLGALVLHKHDAGSNKSSQIQPIAQAYARLITLVCEPTAGAVSRTRQQSQLDSATDVAKRAAGRHMYLILMQYVKLQLESTVSSEVLGTLEPAMNSIFDITPPEARKILNDAMDASGRAILREMFQRYTKFGKWSGV